MRSSCFCYLEQSGNFGLAPEEPYCPECLSGYLRRWSFSYSGEGRALSAYARMRWDKGRNPDKGAADYITHTICTAGQLRRPSDAISLANSAFFPGDHVQTFSFEPTAHTPSSGFRNLTRASYHSNSQSRLSARQRSLESTRVQRSDFRFPCRRRQMQPSPARVAKAGGGTPAPYGHACTNCVRAKCKCMYGDHAGACERYVTSALIGLPSLPLSWTGTCRTQLDHQHNQFLAYLFSSIPLIILILTHFLPDLVCLLGLLTQLQVFPAAEGLPAFNTESQEKSEEGTRIEDSSPGGETGRPGLAHTVSNSREGAQ